MKLPCLPLPAVQAPTTKILPTKCLNIGNILPPPSPRKLPTIRYRIAGNFAGVAYSRFNARKPHPPIALHVKYRCVDVYPGSSQYSVHTGHTTR